MGGPWMIDALSLTGDGRKAIVAGVPGVRVHDLETGAEVGRFQEGDEEDHGVALSPDGRWLLTAGFDGQVRLWDFHSGGLLRVLGSHEGLVFAVAFSADGRLAASGGGGQKQDDKFVSGTDHAIRLWTLPSSTVQTTATPPQTGQRWLVALGALLLFVSVSLFVVWNLRRKSHQERESTVPSDDKPITASPLSLLCPNCHHPLKVKAELSGKKVKCPHCGLGVLVQVQGSG
jgi:WD40 repeat protein